MAEGIYKYGKKSKQAHDFTKARAIAEAKHDTDSYMTDSQKKTVGEFELRAREKKVENMRSVNLNGVEELSKRGGKKSVGFNSIQALAMKDRVVTHNHPKSDFDTGIGARVGTSLSGADVANAMVFDMRAHRAVTPNYTFSISRGKNGWGFNSSSDKAIQTVREALATGSVSKMKEAQREINRLSALRERVKKEWDGYYNKEVASMQKHYFRRNLPKSVVLGRINALASHRATKIMADKYGFKYTRRAR